MKPGRIAQFLVFTAVIALSGVARGEESEIRKSFIEARETNNAVLMTKIVEDNKDKIPAEIQSLLDEALSGKATVEEQDGLLYMAELMAKEYKDVAGNASYLITVKKAAFDVKLPQPAVRLEAKDGIYVIEMPPHQDGAQNIFKPENVIIKKGGTVKWVNNDENMHIFATISLISAGVIRSPSVEPGQSWEYKFERPGEYFYICFIHRSMKGKITVEE
ncbi:MAG: cupredoxin domain-containing protein [Deltaproteobacteria bacterium]|nr:cupredoxin domain-containing protein [Deltaproteobacteria bacterium]